MLRIIKGDSKDIAVTLKNTTGESVTNVYFTSAKLGSDGVSKESDPVTSDGVYYFHLSTGETSNYTAGNFTYDITVKFGSNKVVTAIHNAAGVVEEKTNVIK